MEQTETGKCLAHAKFRQLTRARGRASLLLSVIITLGYGLYVSGIIFAPGLMSRPVEDGGSMTYGILGAIMVIVAGMICSGIYICYSARHIDVLQQELLKDLGYE